MALQCGIVGLPNVGKTTLFNALTQASAESANYPFCTIDPNVGIVTVPDKRLEKISALIQPQKQVPTTMEFVDIAGLVSGASQGEGLGNQFLSHIRQTDAIIHVVRCFEDTNITHVDGGIDPLRDIDTIHTELLLADFESINKRQKKIEKIVSSDKSRRIEFDLVQKLFQALAKGQPARSVHIEENEKPILKSLHLLTAKPVLYVCNVSENIKDSKPFVERVLKEGHLCLTICSSIESEIAQLETDEKTEFLESMGIQEPGLYRLIRESYKLLNLITYFTAGPKEVRAWPLLKGSTAPQAAGVIHGDFQKGFIRAEIFHCNDLFELKSESSIKNSGRLRSEGKNYQIQDGDIVFFRFNVS